MVPDVSSVHFRTVLLAKLSEKLPAIPMKEKKRLSKSAMRRKDESERLDVREELFKYRDLLSVPVEVSASEGKQLAEFESSMRQSFSESTNGDCILLTSPATYAHPCCPLPAPPCSSLLLTHPPLDIPANLLSLPDLEGNSTISFQHHQLLKNVLKKVCSAPALQHHHFVVEIGNHGARVLSNHSLHHFFAETVALNPCPHTPGIVKSFVAQSSRNSQNYGAQLGWSLPSSKAVSRGTPTLNPESNLQTLDAPLYFWTWK